MVCIPLLRSKVVYFKVLDSGHLAKTSIAIISETVETELDFDPRAISNCAKCHFGYFEKSKMAATAETSIAIISETIDRRAKWSWISF